MSHKHELFNSKGFALAQTLLFIVIVAMIGGIGYYVYNANKEANDTLKSATKDSPSIKTDKQEASKSKPSPQYLKIKEWKVKLTLTPDIKDASYEKVPDSSNALYLISASLNKLAKQNQDCTAASRSITIYRVQPGDDNAGSPWTIPELENLGVKVGDYYYLSGAGQPCFGPNVTTVPEQIGVLRASLTNAVATVQAE